MKNFDYKEYLAEGWMFKDDKKQLLKEEESAFAGVTDLKDFIEKIPMLSPEYKKELYNKLQDPYGEDTGEDLFEDGDFCDELCSTVENDFRRWYQKNLFNWSDEEISNYDPRFD